MFNKYKRLLKKAEAKNIQLVNDMEKLSDTMQRYKTISIDSNKKVSKLEKELKELKTQLREQTEADIILNTLKLLGIVKTEEPKKDLILENNNLSGRLGQMQAMGSQQNIRHYGSLLGGLIR